MAKEKKVVSRKNMTKRQWTWHLMKQNKVGYLMVAPYMILFFLFTFLPVLLSLIIGFTDFNMLQWPHFVGMRNYVTMFLDDELFMTALKYTLFFALITGPASYLLSFVVAWFINDLNPRIRAFVTVIFYAPAIGGDVYLIWRTLFSGDSYGWVNAWLLKMGVVQSPILFFTNPKWILPLCVIVALWTSLGTSFLAFIAGLQGIDRSQYEAAAIDGVKNRWQEAWYVTLPNMKPQLMFGAVMAITGSFGFGGIVTNLAGNPPTDYVGYTLSHHISEYGSVRWEVGYSSALTFIMFLIMFGTNLLITRIISKVGQS
ncbi:MAG: sugar ABC transporter permease [Clostridia bacterium]|nr:sugar ABC transporter permease [Clostridia bacterium]